MKPGDIVLIRFPHTDLQGGKLRPALVIAVTPGQHKDLLLGVISSRVHQTVANFDEIIDPSDVDYAATGLKSRSIIRLGRLATVQPTIINARLGNISAQRLQQIKSRLINCLQAHATNGQSGEFNPQLTTSASPLSPSAQRVQDVLAQFGLKLQVVELSASTRTAQEAADAVGCTVGQIVKSLLFRGRTTQTPILVVASGRNRVNEKKLQTLVGEPIEKPDADYVRQQTGFVIGGVPPVGHSQKIRTFIDEDLAQYDEIWAAAGTPNAVFRLTPTDLHTLTGGEIISVK